MKTEEAIDFIKRYAAQTWDYWNCDHDSKVGKRLGALSGVTGYSPELDKAFAVLAAALAAGRGEENDPEPKKKKRRGMFCPVCMEAGVGPASGSRLAAVPLWQCRACGCKWTNPSYQEALAEVTETPEPQPERSET